MATIPYRLTTLADVQASLLADCPLAYDSETDGLYGPIVLAQFFQKGWPEVLIVQLPNTASLAAMLVKEHVLIYNASYDLSTIQRQFATVWPAKVDDIMLLSRLHYYTAQSFTLDDSLQYLLGYSPYARARIDKTAMQKATWTGKLTAEQLAYAALDVYYLPAMYEQFAEEAQHQAYELDIVTLKHFITSLQPTGLPVDSEQLANLYTANQVEIASYAMPINVNSYQQVRPYINSVMSDDIGLSTLALQGNERAQNVKTVRKLLKLNSFLTKFNAERIYGIFAPNARSGRATCTQQNLQQLPRASKGVFGVDEASGRCLIFSDFAQLELRCAAAMVNEATMVKLFREKLDMHNYVAEFLFGKDFTKQQRQITKTCNFNLLYGGGAQMLQTILIKSAGLFLELSEVDAIRKKWLRIFPGFAAWHQQGISAWRKQQAWATPMGRKYVANLMTDQLNICIQGYGAEVAKLAMHRMLSDGWFAENGVHLANFIHDSYIFDAPNDAVVYEEAAKRIANSMHSAWLDISRFVSVKDLPMPVQVMVGFNWGDIEKGNHFYQHSLED